MTSVVVNDASCLIDLGKGGLLPFLCSLPYRFIVPLPIRTSETLSLTDQDWHGLDSAGMVTHDLTPTEVEAAFGIKGNNPALSANDCFCFVTAQVNDGILLTGDAQLAQAARRNGLSVHGVLWVIDQLKQEKVCEYAILAKALILWVGLGNGRSFIVSTDSTSRALDSDRGGSRIPWHESCRFLFAWKLGQREQPVR